MLCITFLSVHARLEQLRQTHRWKSSLRKLERGSPGSAAGGESPESTGTQTGGQCPASQCLGAKRRKKNHTEI